MPHIEFVDVHDDTALKAWYAVESASISHDRPWAAQRSFETLANSVRNPRDPNGRSVLLAAVEDGETVGIADLDMPSTESHLLRLEIHVRPDRRRRGLGRALWQAADDVRAKEGRTTTFGEAIVPPEASLPFAEALGFETLGSEDHLVLPLPAHLEEIDVPGFEIVLWGNRCPDDLLDAYVVMRNQMGQDLPGGKGDHEPVPYTRERVRVEEKRTARSYDRIIAAAKEIATGELVGYSLLFLPHGSDQAIQDDTLVMPTHRGLRLGLALKTATLEVIQHDFPERKSIHTWTDPSNVAMQRTNYLFGFRKLELMHEVQRQAD